ncbi:MAG: hypothetical protein V3U76_01715 [Granulosicoccus sp.]
MEYNLTRYTLITVVVLLAGCSNDGNGPGATSDATDRPSNGSTAGDQSNNSSPTNDTPTNNSTTESQDNNNSQGSDSSTENSTAEDPGSNNSPGNDTAANSSTTGEQSVSNDPDNENAAAPEPAAVITLDNHIELLDFVFAIYSGLERGSEILALPAYPDSAFDDKSIIDGPSDGSRNPEVVQDIVCNNGGTLVHTQDSWLDVQDREIRKISNFVFNNCQHESTIFNGELLRDMLYGSLELESSGLTAASQSLDTSFSGQVGYLYRETRAVPTLHYSFDNVQYAVTSSADGLFELQDANSYYGKRSSYWKQLSGGFSVTAPETGNQQLVVSVPEALEYSQDFGDADLVQNFQTGSMQVTAENGDTLTLYADTGNAETVKIDIQSGDVVDSVEQPWSNWQDSLELRLDLAPPIDCSIPALQDLCNP